MGNDHGLGTGAAARPEPYLMPAVRGGIGGLLRRGAHALAYTRIHALALARIRARVRISDAAVCTALGRLQCGPRLTARVPCPEPRCQTPSCARLYRSLWPHRQFEGSRQAC